MTRGKVEVSEIEAALAELSPPRPGHAWWPHVPTAKQAEFIGRPEPEGLYGGAAGGGKSDALLMDATKYVHIPGYSALILRQSYTDLALPNAIMDRAKQWWCGKVRWSEQDKRFTFPSGATLTFAFLKNDADKYRYASAEFQYVAFDELTQFAEKTFTFMRSRLRGPSSGPLSKVPKRLRGATNPGNVGHEWVYQRFVDPDTRHHEAFFVQAKATDNPHLDLVDYGKQLDGLDDETRRMLRDGDWRRDPSGLVYQYRPELNLAPPMKYSGEVILAIDYGFSDACAFVEIGWSGRTTYILRAHKEEGMTPTRAAEFVEAWQRERGGYYQIVGDGGGLGKGYVEEANERGESRIELAKKTNKVAYIRFMRGDMERGHVKLVMPDAAPLMREWAKLPWNAARSDYADGFEDHLSDAALYGWRASPAYLFSAAAKQEDETAEAREDRAEAELERLLMDEPRGRNAWAKTMVRRSRH